MKHTKARKEAFEKWSPSITSVGEGQDNVPQVNDFMSLSNGVRKEDVLAQIKAMQGRR